MQITSMKAKILPLNENIKNEYQTADMTGEKLYIGIDMHDKQWTITVRHNQRTLHSGAIDPNAKTLLVFLKRRYPGAEYHSAYEAGYFGFKPHRDLCLLEIHNIIINPADIPTTNKERSNKNDKWDSQKIAKYLETASLSGIYIPSEKEIANRNLIRKRKQLVKDRTRIKNRIKSFLRFVGIEPESVRSKSWTMKYIARLEQIVFNEESDKMVLHLHLSELNFLSEQIKALTKYLDNVLLSGEPLKIITNLIKLPGIGKITAKTLYLELIDIRRYKGRKTLVSYVGFTPGMHQSGEKEYNLGISKRQNKFLRSILIEAAWIARKKGKYLEKFNKLSGRMAANKAIIRIGKMLLLDVRREWLLALKEDNPVLIN